MSTASVKTSEELNKSISKRTRYSYQLQQPSEESDASGSNGEGLCRGKSQVRYENDSSPKVQFKNWPPPCRRVRSMHGMIMPTRQQNRQNQSRRFSHNLVPKIHCFGPKRASRPQDVPRHLEQSIGTMEPFYMDPEENALHGARSPKQMQVSNIASQSEVGSSLTPVEVATDYLLRIKLEVVMTSRNNSSSNEREPSLIQEEIPQDEENENFLQQKPKHSAAHSTCRNQARDNSEEILVRPSNQNTAILEDPFQPLMENHSEQIPDDIGGPRLNTRRNAVCNELEKKTSRVKINGARMSLHDMRVDLGEITERSRIRESVLENSDIEATEEDNTILEEYLNSQNSARREAICQEKEKTMSTFKVNGVKMSLFHMRAELGGLNEFGLSDERLEEELNKPCENPSKSTERRQTFKQRRRRTTTAIRKFITDLAN